MRVQKTFWDYFWLAKFFLRSAGILPIGGTPSTWKSILTQLLPAAPLSYGLYVVVPQINYIFFQNHAMDDLLEAVTVVITVLGGQFRSIFLAVHRRKITQLFSICESLWDHATSSDYEIILTWAQRARFFSTTYFCAAQFSTTMFAVTSTIRQLSLATNSTTRYYPFGFEDFRPSPEYEIKFTLQVICGHLGMQFVSAADMAGTLLALSMCGQLALIQSWLLDIANRQYATIRRNTNEDLDVTLKKCIRRHQVVLDFCIKLDEVVRYINLVQVITGMYVMAISVARLTVSLGSCQYWGTLLMSISGLFFLCWPADNLSFASSEIAKTVYEVPWYRSSPCGKTAVAIMLTRSQRPARLTAGNFVTLSLETFSSIVSSSISFCMVLYSF